MEPQAREYTRDEVTMAFTEYPGSPERTYVLVHGIGMGRIVYEEVAAELVGADRESAATGSSGASVAAGRALAVDLPGFGDSPEPGSAATLAETAEVIADFIREQATGNVTLVGHSMGTQIVAEVAHKHPELLDTLVLIAPTVNRHERTAAKQAARMVQDLTGEAPKVLLTGLVEYAKTNPVWFANKLKFMLNHELEALCPEIDTPTLVLRGETDPVCPRDWVAEVAELLPHSEMREIPERGHEAIIESPEPVASMVLEFVAEHATP